MRTDQSTKPQIRNQTVAMRCLPRNFTCSSTEENNRTHEKRSHWHNKLARQHHSTKCFLSVGLCKCQRKGVVMRDQCKFKSLMKSGAQRHVTAQTYQAQRNVIFGTALPDMP
eukprot:4651206-Amphidinium_carterae.1